MDIPKTSLIFHGSNEEATELKCFANTKDEIFICIDANGFNGSYITLDKPTAIKLHRELKKQISFI